MLKRIRVQYFLIIRPFVDTSGVCVEIGERNFEIRENCSKSFDEKVNLASRYVTDLCSPSLILSHYYFKDFKRTLFGRALFIILVRLDGFG